MLACLLLALLADDGPAAPPGTVLPNKDELVKTFREQLSKRQQPLDNYVRRQRYPGRAEGLQESFVQINGDYRKSLTKDHLGVERLTVMTPTLYFALVKLPYEPGWKFNYRLETDEGQREHFRKTWLAEAGISDSGGLDLGINAIIADPPQATVTKVTAERVHDQPVYRFHFTRAPVGEGPPNVPRRTQEGTIDVDPALSWAIVHAGFGYRETPADRVDADFTYQGQVHGRAALRRAVFRSTRKTADGQTQTLAERTVDIVQFEEQPTYDPGEYRMGFYGGDLPHGDTPYRAYALVAATAVVLALGGYAVWRRLAGRGPAGPTGALELPRP